MNNRELARLYRDMKAKELEQNEACTQRYAAEENLKSAVSRHEEVKNRMLSALRSINQPVVIDGKVLSVGNDRPELYLKIQTAKIIK